jgi:hypothetical protein
MKVISRWMKALYLATSGALLVGSGSCVPDNLWADIWGTSIITGFVEAARNTLLVTAGLQTP